MAFVKSLMGVSFSDANCGFKAAASRKAIETLFPLIRPEYWDKEIRTVALGSGILNFL